MAEESYPIGLRNDMLTAENFKKMGIALWVYSWLVDKTTEEYQRPDGEIRGKVLGGSVIKAEQIATHYDMTAQTARNHLQTLYRVGKIEKRQVQDGFRIEVRHSTKWPQRFSSPNASPLSDSQTTRLEDSKSFRVESPCNPESLGPLNSVTLGLLNPREPSIKTMQLDTDCTEDNASTIQGETPASRPPEWWLKVQERVTSQLTPGALHEVQRCALSVNGHIVTVHPAADGRERVVRNLAVLLQAARRELGHSVDMMIGPNIEARAGPE